MKSTAIAKCFAVRKRFVNCASLYRPLVTVRGRNSTKVLPVMTGGALARMGVVCRIVSRLLSERAGKMEISYVASFNFTGCFPPLEKLGLVRGEISRYDSCYIVER